MRFWDASAVVPLLLREEATAACRRLYEADPQVLVWWGTEVECTSAICRRERSRDLDPTDADQALASLERIREHWHEVQAVATVQIQARRLLRLHPLRTADALQLAAALVASESRPTSLPFVALDLQLARAAKLEGLGVVAISR